MQEIANVARFLTKQNINYDMQNEILKYYEPKQIKQKRWLLYVEYSNDYEHTMEFKYHEVIPLIPIEQFNLINLYKFFYEQNKTLEEPSNEMLSYDKDRYTYYCHFKKQEYTITTKDLIWYLSNYHMVEYDEFKVSVDEFDDKYWGVYLREIEIDI